MSDVVMESLMALEVGDEVVAAYEKKIDALVLALLECGDLVDEDLTHTMSDGVYVREAHLPEATVVVSMRHKTAAPWVVLKGRILMFTPGEGVVELVAGDHGVTTPGSRRVGLHIEDSVLATFHPYSDGETIEQIEERLYEDMPLPNGNTARKEWKKRLAVKELEARNGRNCDSSSDQCSRWILREQVEEEGGEESSGCGGEAPAGSDQVREAAGGSPEADAGVEPHRVRAEA